MIPLVMANETGIAQHRIPGVFVSGNVVFRRVLSSLRDQSKSSMTGAMAHRG